VARIIRRNDEANISKHRRIAVVVSVGGAEIVADDLRHP